MIRIVTDSSCDLPDDLVARHRIAVVPLTIRFGDEDLVDGEQLTSDEFWRRLTQETTQPQTAAPSAERFQETFRKLSDEGADGLVVICLSSRISATHESAVGAAEEFRGGIPIRVVDSALASTALGLVAIEAAELAATGVGIDPVEEIAVAAAAATHLFATLDTIEFLHRGGRLGRAQALLGNLLDLKPLISFDEGALEAAGKVRTRRKALAAVTDHLAELGDRVRRFAIVHSDPADLDEFLTAIRAVRDEEPLVTRVGPVVGTNAGPGMAGVVYRLG